MANQEPWPFMPPQSTEQLLLHCDDTAYTATPDTLLYKLVDAICGTTGAGALVNEIFLARANGALETIYFTDLDYVFSKANFLARSPAESYTYNPLVDVLTAAQWNEVRTKDAWYRSRIKAYFLACGLGTTFAGIALCVYAALGVDCDIYEVWRYLDNFGITESLGRAPSTARNELVIKPHKTQLAPDEFRLARDMLDSMTTLDTIITINPNGLSVLTPFSASSAAADSTYYEVQKMVTPTPLMNQLPPPDLLPIDLLPTEQWMYSKSPTLAPYAAFNITQEYGYFYLIGGGQQSPIDSVSYGTINSPESNKITVFEVFAKFTVGTGTVTVPEQSWVFDSLDLDLFSWTRVSFQGDMYPPEDAINAGVAALISAINGCTGTFVIVGYGLSAIVASYVYDQIRTGSLVNRRPQFLGGVVFGNARRQTGFVFPGNIYTNAKTSGGILNTDRLTNSEPLWWEFVVPKDIMADVTPAANLEAAYYARVFEAYYPNYSGNISAVLNSMSSSSRPPNGKALMQNILNATYTQSPAITHNQYFTYQPLATKGDQRTTVQMAGDYIASLANAQFAATGQTVTTYPVSAYEVTGNDITQASSFFAENIDPRIKYVWVPWPSSSYPTSDSITTGVNNLITMINRNPGKFMLIGNGPGAIVASLVYEQIVGGALQHRQADLLAATMFGNPMRQATKIFNGGTDPGGHGVDGTRMTGTPDLWWEFADPTDIRAVQGDDTNGVWMSTAFDAILDNYAGDLSVITNDPANQDAPVNFALFATTLVNWLYGSGAQINYAFDTPLASAGDDRSSYQIALDYLASFASQSVPYVGNPSDPMSGYRPEANFESFDNVTNFGPWQTYEVADSPDNYPGGKFGIHGQTPPAVNPDGTPYNFPWASQAAYIAFKITEVVAMGGQADAVRFRLPASVNAITKEVYLPEYSIAYSAPAMDSTVSTSLTARRSKTVNQSGSNQTFARVTS